MPDWQTSCVMNSSCFYLFHVTISHSQASPCITVTWRVRVLRKKSFWFIRSGVGPQVLHFKQVPKWHWCCWTRDHLWEPLLVASIRLLLPEERCPWCPLSTAPPEDCTWTIYWILHSLTTFRLFLLFSPSSITHCPLNCIEGALLLSSTLILFTSAQNFHLEFSHFFHIFIHWICFSSFASIKYFRKRPLI